MSETPEQAAEWDQAVLNGPRPTPYGDPMAYQACLEYGPEGFVCGRWRGHVGQHVAPGLDTVYEVWPGEQP